MWQYVGIAQGFGLSEQVSNALLRSDASGSAAKGRGDFACPCVPGGGDSAAISGEPPLSNCRNVASDEGRAPRAAILSHLKLKLVVCFDGISDPHVVRSGRAKGAYVWTQVLRPRRHNLLYLYSIHYYNEQPGQFTTNAPPPINLDSFG